jgi:DNA-binding protein H-NS
MVTGHRKDDGDREINMPKIDLNGMRFEDLWLLHEEITKILSGRIIAEKDELEKRLAKLNPDEVKASAGSEPASTGPTRRKYPRVFPKYRNPASSSETWSGRGKQPRWLVVALKKGHTIDDFKISQDGPANKINSKTGTIKRMRRRT